MSTTTTTTTAGMRTDHAGQVGALTAAAARFFALPLQERLRLDNRLSPHFRGYTRLGHEITAGRADAREQIDFAAEQAPVPR